LPQPNLRPTPKIRHFTYTFKGPRPVRPLGQKLQRNITGRGAGNSSAQEALGRRDTVVVVMLRRGRSRRRRGRNDTRHLALPLPSICVSSARRYSSPRCEWTTLEGRRSRPRLLQQDPATDRAGPPAAGDDGEPAKGGGLGLGFGIRGRRGRHWARRVVIASSLRLAASPSLASFPSSRHPACDFRFSQISHVLQGSEGNGLVSPFNA
jgi:hypothetical protein